MKPTKRKDIFALIEKGLPPAEIAERTGCTKQTVYECRWRAKDPDRYRQASIERSRRKGHKAREAENAERRAESEARAAEIKPLLDQGLSWGQVAARLGVTKNTIAGLVHRNRSLITQGAAA